MTDQEKDMLQDEMADETALEEEAAEGCSETELLKAELAELEDRYRRLMAEYDNYRKRSTRERDEIYPNATAAAVEKFLPILDSLERASEFERGTEEFARGFDMICQSFGAVFRECGVEAIGEVGEPFDPKRHNAVMHIEDAALGENVISQVLQKGYQIGERVIRYAMVQTAN